MKIVVTGGAGFIGSHLSERLLLEGHEVICIDNFDAFYSPKIKRNNIAKMLTHDRFLLIEGDIRDRESIERLLPENVNAIVHLAAKAGIRPSMADPVAYQETNVMGTQNLLEIAKERNIGQFIFASSSSVYGNNANVPWSESDYVLKPISPYASSKISGELLGHVYSHLYDIRFIALRFFTVYGPRQRPDLAIHKFYDLLRQDKVITLYGDGSTRRDYTYVDDIVQGVVGAIHYKDSMYEIINLGNNVTVTLNELVETLEDVSNKTFSKHYTGEQPGDVKQTWAKLDKAKKMLNYSPQYDLKKGLSSFIEWYEEQQN